MTTRKDASIMSQPDLGANLFTFTGDRTHIVYFTDTPGPIIIGQEGGKLDYQGIEGNFTFFGRDISLQESPLGTLLTVTLKLMDDTGGLTLTVLVPRVFGASVETRNTVTFETIAIKASSRGFVVGEGVELAYTIIPLLGTGKNEIQPL
jgi:hypothetical protein